MESSRKQSTGVRCSSVRLRREPRDSVRVRRSSVRVRRSSVSMRHSSVRVCRSPIWVRCILVRVRRSSVLFWWDIAQSGCGVVQLKCGVAQLVVHWLVLGRLEFESRPCDSESHGGLGSSCWSMRIQEDRFRRIVKDEWMNERMLKNIDKC